jgi:hypothetical protein
MFTIATDRRGIFFTQYCDILPVFTHDGSNHEEYVRGCNAMHFVEVSWLSDEYIALIFG